MTREYDPDSITLPRRMYSSAMKTPDGTILQSFHRHDYKTHVDTITGETYMIDGGIDYIRCSVNQVPAEMLTVYEDDPFEVKREIPVWGTYGKSGKESFRWVSVAEMEDGHIEALLDPAMYVRRSIKDVLLEEKLKRGL